MRLQKILYLLFIGVLLLPVAQQLLGFFSEDQLSGYYRKMPEPEFSEFKYVTLNYQQEMEKYLNENFGFRPTLVRLRNQFYFSVLNQSPNTDYTKTSDGGLIENLYINGYFGNDFIDKRGMDDFTADIKKLQDTLAHHHIVLLTVIAPSKAFYNSELLPGRMDISPGSRYTNYSYFKWYANNKQINLIDFNAWFLQMKTTAPHPLYGKYGAHWTRYGVTLAFDSILSTLGKLSGKPYPRLKILSCKPETDQTTDDYDIVCGAVNLLSVPLDTSLVTPVIEYDTAGRFHPAVIGVTDSYYGVPYDMGLLKNCFISPDYWFGYQELYPLEKYDSLKTKKDFLQNSILGQDAIILMCTPHNIRYLSWGFVGDALQLFDKDSPQPYKYDFHLSKRVDASIDYITHDTAWAQGLLNNARMNHVNPDSILFRDAYFLSGGKAQ